MEEKFVLRSEISDLEWNFDKVDWKRPDVDKNILNEVTERNSYKGFLRLSVYVAGLVLAGAGFIVLKEHSIFAGIFFLYMYYFLFGFIVAIGHELQHKTVFNKKLDWFSETIFFIVQALMWNSPRYARISHRLHHRYTMVRGMDPESAWPDIITVKWLKKFLFGITLKILIIGATIDFFKGIKLQFMRIMRKKDLMMLMQCNDRDIKSIRIESLLILFSHALIFALSIYYGYWEYILLINIAWHVGSGFEAIWHSTEHICRPYNVNDQRVCTRSVKVSPFIKFIFWGLDDHVEHHLFPAVPSCNLPRLHKVLVDYVPKPKNVYECWKEMFLTAVKKENNSQIEFLATVKEI